MVELKDNSVVLVAVNARVLSKISIDVVEVPFELLLALSAMSLRVGPVDLGGVALGASLAPALMTISCSSATVEIRERLGLSAP